MLARLLPTRVDRALVALGVVALVAWIPANANPWHLVVVDDGIEPGLLVLVAAALGALCVRGALRLQRVDPASGATRATRLAIALGAYPLLLVGVVVLPVLAWPSAVDAAAVIARDEAPDARFPMPEGNSLDESDLVVEVTRADCFLRIDGVVTLTAERGIASRRVELHRDDECVEIEITFPLFPPATTVSVRAACERTSYLINDATLDVRVQSIEVLEPDICVDGRALHAGRNVVPPP